MCFDVVSTSKRKVAEKPIICYKRHITDNSTNWKVKGIFYTNFWYKRFRKTPKVELEVKVRKVQYSGLVEIESEVGVIEEGYHTNNRDIIINAVFVIPKGTQYYENDFERVSEQLIYLGKPDNWLTKLALWYYKNFK